MESRRKAVVIRRRGGPEVLELVNDHPVPEPKAEDDVIVEVQAASINPIDTYLRAGKVPLPLRYPWILGGDPSGVVTAVGSGVARFKRGHRAQALDSSHLSARPRRPGPRIDRGAPHPGQNRA